MYEAPSFYQITWWSWRDTGRITTRMTRAAVYSSRSISRERGAYPSVSENKGEIVRQRAQLDEQRQKGSIKSSGFYRRLTKWAPLSPFVPISPRNDRSPLFLGRFQVLGQILSSTVVACSYPFIFLAPGSPASFQYPGHVYSAPAPTSASYYPDPVPCFL